MILSSDFPQERKRLDVTAGQDVLAVVDDLSGLAIGKRRRPSTQPVRASSTSTPRPFAASLTAALRPANPAPITTTSTLVMRATPIGEGR